MKCNTVSMLGTHEELQKELETHRGKVDVMSSELFRAFLHEFHACTQDRSSSSQVTNPTLNAATNFQLEISAESSESRDAVTKIRYETGCAKSV